MNSQPAREPGPPSRQQAFTYLLPLRWTEPGPIAELGAYLEAIGRSELIAEIMVVDGSPGPIFEQHHNRLRGIARHIPPDPHLSFAMGKVNGVITGVIAAANELIVIADDDVRYRPADLVRARAEIAEADLVRPQNYFSPVPWHALWDTARSCLNRIFTGDLAFPVGDFPGTLIVRRQSFLESGAYNGDCIFENLELMRTLLAAGGAVSTPLDFYIARRPPSARHFLGQRLRHAYDDLAMPLRLGGFLTVLPLAIAQLAGRRRRWFAIWPLAAIAVAEAGRRRAGGATFFPAGSSLLAPAWIAERSLCSWLALLARLRGGVRYSGGTVPSAATPLRVLHRRRP